MSILFFAAFKAPQGWERVTKQTQLWRFSTTLADTNKNLSNDKLYIVLRSHHDKWLGVENDGRTVVNNQTKIKRWEKFEVIFLGDGLVSLKTWNGTYFSAQPDGKLATSTCVIGKWEKLEMFVRRDEKAAFRSAYGNWLSAQKDGSVDFNRDQLGRFQTFYGCKVGTMEKWTPYVIDGKSAYLTSLLFPDVKIDWNSRGHVIFDI